MGKRNLTNERLQCRQCFVTLGITEFKILESMHGVDRRTISKWADEENWVSQRASALVSPDSVAQKVVKVLAAYVDEIEQMQLEGMQPDPGQIKRVLEYSKALRQLDQEYDMRGAVLHFGQAFISYVAKLPEERELLKSLQRVMPGFFSHIEQSNGRLNR